MTTMICSEDARNAEAIRACWLTELVRGSDRRLIDEMTPVVRHQDVSLDLGSVERIDAAGIAALISLYRLAQEAGHGFSVSNPAPHVHELLSLVGLDRILLSDNASLTTNSGCRLAQNAA